MGALLELMVVGGVGRLEQPLSRSTMGVFLTVLDVVETMAVVFVIIAAVLLVVEVAASGVTRMTVAAMMIVLAMNSEKYQHHCRYPKQ